MKKIENYSDKLLMFEIARLRTLFKNKPEIKDRIVKRYKLIVDEYNGRNLRWFWSSHILDKLIKADWCSEAGGQWITIRGKHICVGKEVKVSPGFKGTKIIHGEDSKTWLVYSDKSNKEFIEDVRADLTHLPKDKVKGLTKVTVDDRYLTIREHYEDQGRELPSQYEKFASGQCGGYYSRTTNSICIYSGSRRTFHHEFGHHAYTNLTGDEKRAFKNAISWDGPVSGYAKVSIDESFAEATRFYFGPNAEDMEEEYPKTKKILDKIYKGD